MPYRPTKEPDLIEVNDENWLIQPFVLEETPKESWAESISIGIAVLILMTCVFILIVIYR